jgi:hypothetical protein
MLQAELDRMERESQDRTTLHELFAALRNDPFLIAETLAQANLTDKAIRHHYAWDPALHAEERKRAEAIATQVRNGADWSKLGASYSRHKYLPEDDASPARRHHPGPEMLRVSAYPRMK